MGNKERVGPLYVGIDLGSSCVHYAVLDRSCRVLFSPNPLMHFGDPMGAVSEAWSIVCDRFGRREVISTAFTGCGAKTLASMAPDIAYVYDSVAIPNGVRIIDPHAGYVFHMGARDAYFFHIRTIQGRPIIQQWCTGTKCGGGSGLLIEKQCRRLLQGEAPVPLIEAPPVQDQIRTVNRRNLQTRMEWMFEQAREEASRSTMPSEFLARCGVVIQSDLIHKQNEGASRRDNLAGLFLAVARNYKVDVLGARDFHDSQTRAVATGGVMALDLVHTHLSRLLGIEIHRPREFHNMAAIGAAAKALEEQNRFVFDAALLEKAAEHSRRSRPSAGSLSEALRQVTDQREELAQDIPAGTEVVIGIDGGSTTTKGALVEVTTGRLLDKLYVKTHGNPEASLRRVIRFLSRHKDKVVVRGVGATGSARKLCARILVNQKKAHDLAQRGIECADRITDEITCHALGVRHMDPQIDTIFEIGGQDMKFTRFGEEGSVRDAKMNYSCQAGSGQTLENMADLIDLRVEDSLQDAALRAERVPVIDSTCGVFMEMDENRLIAEGFSKEEIAAAIVRGTAASYYYKFVGGSQQVGNRCSAQGGPALGRAFLAALAQITGRPIQAHPHREMFGAWGQALDVIDRIRRAQEQGRPCDTAFRGWGVVDMPLEKRRVSCREVSGDRCCGIRSCQLEQFTMDGDRILTGGFCPLGRPKTHYVDLYHTIYERHFKRQGALLSELTEDLLKTIGSPRVIGVKRSTVTLGEKGIWAAALLKGLGFFPVVSPRSDGAIAKTGVDKSRTEFCIARKLATGHAAVLKAHPLVEVLFNPSFIEHHQDRGPDLKYCIYTASEGYVLNDVLSLDKARQLNPILQFNDPPRLMEELAIELGRVGLSVTRAELEQALAYADRAEEAFRQDLGLVGEAFLTRIERGNTKAYVGLGRDYVLLDPEASSSSGTLFSQIRGLDYIPQIFLEQRFMGLSLDGLVTNEFWVESVKILKAHLFVANHPLLFGIRMMNFACGPDSLKIYQERQIQEAAHKPLLVLVTDGQTNNAPFVTRTEAHERVVEQTLPCRLDRQAMNRPRANPKGERTWLIPFMGHASDIAAAGARGFGIDSQVLPTGTPRGYELARRHLSTEVCQPLKGVLGDALGYLLEEVDRRGKGSVCGRYAIMLPTTSGPCRFGKYAEVVRRCLDEEDLADVPVSGPSDKTDYLDIPFPDHVGPLDRLRFQQVLFKGICSADLLEDAFLRFRPYAQDKQEITRLKQDRLLELVNIAEQGAPMPALLAWGHRTVACFKACATRTTDRFPLVLYIGEIYMRQHDGFTDHVVDHLEDMGLELVRSPVTEWLDYINKDRLFMARQDIRLGWKYGPLGRILHKTPHYARSLVKARYMAGVERRLERPFHDVLADRHLLPSPMEMIATLERHGEGHRSIKGESPLSTGMAYHVMRGLGRSGKDGRICGIVHVGPFTCMQESVATAKIEAMVNEYRKGHPDLVLPMVHAFFGDSPDPNLDAQLAVFREQCYQRRQLLGLTHRGVGARRPVRCGIGTETRNHAVQALGACQAVAPGLPDRRGMA